MEDLEFPPIYGFTPLESSVIIEGKTKGKKITLATKVDEGFFFNLSSNKENLGKFLGLSLDESTRVLILTFENKAKEAKDE